MNYDFSCYPVDQNFIRRDTLVLYHFLDLLDKLISMFVYENLPENIYQPFLQYVLFLNGNIGWVKVPERDDLLHIVDGNPGGPPNEYYIPSQYVWANPVLGSGIEEIGKTCVVGYNNSLHTSVAPMLYRYANILADNDLSINIAQVNTRLSAFFTATTEAERASAEQVIKNMIEGKFSVAVEGNFMAGIKTNPLRESVTSGTVHDLIELNQYTLANYYHAIGINSNYNMKRERLNSSEVELNDDILQLNIDDMYRSRIAMVDEVNAKYGTNILVRLNDIFIHNYDGFAGETTPAEESEVQDENVGTELNDAINQNESVETYEADENETVETYELEDVSLETEGEEDDENDRSGTE